MLHSGTLRNFIASKDLHRVQPYNLPVKGNHSYLWNYKYFISPRGERRESAFHKCVSPSELPIPYTHAHIELLVSVIIIQMNLGQRHSKWRRLLEDLELGSEGKGGQ